MTDQPQPSKQNYIPYHYMSRIQLQYAELKGSEEFVNRERIRFKYLIRDYGKVYTATSIARALGVSRQSVARMLREPSTTTRDSTTDQRGV
jgi:DNA invertase Pin-like site-specific DNA recombinase